MEALEGLFELVLMLPGRAAMHGFIALAGGMVSAGVAEFVLQRPLDELFAFVEGVIGFFLFLALSLLGEQLWHRIRPRSHDNPPQPVEGPACGRGQGEGC